MSEPLKRILENQYETALEIWPEIPFVRGFAPN